MTVWKDGATAEGLGKDRHAMDVATRALASVRRTTIEMARAGGFAIEFDPTQ